MQAAGSSNRLRGAQPQIRLPKRYARVLTSDSPASSCVRRNSASVLVTLALHNNKVAAASGSKMPQVS